METKDALLHAINEEYVEAVEVLLDHEESIHSEGEPWSWETLSEQEVSHTDSTSRTVHQISPCLYQSLSVCSVSVRREINEISSTSLDRHRHLLRDYVTSSFYSRLASLPT